MVETLRRGIPDLVALSKETTKSADGVYPDFPFCAWITKIFESSRLDYKSADRDSLSRDIGGIV